MSDLISRQAAIDAAIKADMENNGGILSEKRARVFDAHISRVPPVQPTQTNCEYCHTDRDGYVFPLDKNSHAFIDRDKIVLKANGWRGKAKIKYCPICGRRLTDAVD